MSATTVSNTELQQEKNAAFDTHIARTDINEVQLDIIAKLTSKYRLVDTPDQMCEKGFNQQVKAAISSARNRQMVAYTNADRAGNNRAKEVASSNLDELETMQKFLR